MMSEIATCGGGIHKSCVTALVAIGLIAFVSPASADWDTIVSPTGRLRLDHSGQELASVVPGLFETDWRSASMQEGPADAGVVDGMHHGTIRAPGGTVVDVHLRVTDEGDASRYEYRLTPQAAMTLNSLYVGLQLPVRFWSGGTFVADETSGALPDQFGEVVLHSSTSTSLRLNNSQGNWLQLELEQATHVLVQDDRQWGQTFTVRIGPQTDGGDAWEGGRPLVLAFRLSGDGGMTVEKDGPVTIQAGADWLPLDVTLDIEAGSALDFSGVIPRHAPAGKFGRVIVNADGKFAFAERPEEPVRFYGVNLCYSAHYLSHEVADRLAERLWRLGYNSLRVHHYESELVDRSSNQDVQLRPDKLDQLDYLLAALKRRGIYVTTDLFVSRPVAASRIYPGQSGEIAMDSYKMAVHVNERAYEDFKAFATVLLNHVNPYTKLRYAEDPMLGWLSLVNEDNPGNFIDQLEGPLREDWLRAWNRWLERRYRDRSALLAAIGPLSADQAPQKGNVPLQNVYATTPATVQFNIFLAEVERDFFERTKRFLREEVRCDALLTDINAWTNPVQMQAVRRSFDYVDDHFYVDHPQFLDRPWSLPSQCPNTSPIAEGATGGRSSAFTRLFGKPFTLTEFNYSSPGRYRGVGGILTGAMGALQDWDGVWRFSYAHDRDRVAAPGPLNYFDLAADPLNQAAERASLCLFLRGDLQPAEHAVSITATEDQLLKSATTSRDKTPPWNGMAWLTQVGWTIDDQQPDSSDKLLVLPMIEQGEKNPFAQSAQQQILTQLRHRGWLSSSNATEFESNRFQSDNGQVTIDAPNNILLLDTARTAGGFAPAGKQIKTKYATIDIDDIDATVWVSSLDNQPIIDSKRLLITHLTDLQNSGSRYGDRARKVLLDWGRLPHLVQAGRARINLRLANASRAKIYGLSTSGKRLSQLSAMPEAGGLTIPISIADDGKARMLYEVDMRQ